MRYDGIIRLIVDGNESDKIVDDSTIDSAIADDSIAGVVRENILETDEYLNNILL